MADKDYYQKLVQALRKAYKDGSMGTMLDPDLGRQAAVTINNLGCENQVLRAALKNAEAENRRYIQVCEAQDKQIGDLLARAEKAEKELERR